jgi:small-conductance mechanosensitive channel
VIAQLGSQIESLASDVTSTEARLAVTAAIVLAVIAIGWFLVPRVVSAGNQFVSRWLEHLLDGKADRHRESLAGALPISFALRVLVGVLQLLLFAIAGTVVLAIWNRFGLIRTAVPIAEVVLSVGFKLGLTAVLLGGAYITSGVLEEYISDLSADSDQITAHQQQLLTRIVQVGLLIIAGIAALGIWGVNLGGLLVGAGFLGIVIGMAARQTLGSLIAGFVLMFSRPFEIGDWVAIGDQEGFVTDITIMNTHVRNFDGEFVVIPNDSVGNAVVTNRSREGRLRIRMEVGIGYDDDAERATGVAQEVLDGIDLIANNPPPHVFPSEFGDSAIVLDLRYWIDPPTPQARWRSRAAVVNAIQHRFSDEGISIPFPQRTVSWGTDSDGAAASERLAGPEDDTRSTQ